MASAAGRVGAMHHPHSFVLSKSPADNKC